MQHKKIDNYVLAVAVILVVLGLITGFRPTAPDEPKPWALNDSLRR